MSEVAAARGFILGFIDALKITNSDQYDKYAIIWKNIDQIDDEVERHKKTIAYYKSIAFPFCVK